MAHPLHHAMASAHRFGGKALDYVAIHEWFDASKAYHADVRHRALRHHAEGIFFCESIFGRSIINSDGKEIPVRLIGEQHVREDLGFIPSLSFWLSRMRAEPWMSRNVRLPKAVQDEIDAGAPASGYAPSPWAGDEAASSGAPSLADSGPPDRKKA